MIRTATKLHLYSGAFHLEREIAIFEHCEWQEPYFFLEKAVEDKDEHSLEGVEYGEEVCHDNRGLVDEEEAKGPG